MPISEYFSGHGKQVAEEMRKRYGKRWKQVFYAVANKLKQTPPDRSSRAWRILAGKEK